MNFVASFARKKKSISDNEDFDWDFSEATASATDTAWSNVAPRRRGVFGSRMGGGLLRPKKAAAPKTPNRLCNQDALSEELGFPIEVSSPDSHRRLSRTLESPTESSLDMENLLNPQPQRPSFERSNSLLRVLPNMPKPFNTHFQNHPRARSISYSRESSNTTNTTGEFSSSGTSSSFLEGDNERQPKKICARRASIQGSVTMLANCRSFSHLAASTKEWKEYERSSPPAKVTASFFNVDGSPARSVASSRKRGVGGSPLFLSDLDNEPAMTSNSGLPRRTILMSSPDGALVPPFFYSTDAAVRSNSPLDCRCRGVMDIDSDDDSKDESLGGHVSHPDSSFEECLTNDMVLTKDDKHREIVTDLDVLETMPSLKDLVFVIKELRKEKKRAQWAIFGEGGSWTVAPKNTWRPAQRSQLFQWAAQLGFTTRPLGGHINVLQISKAKGPSLLKQLESALQRHKRMEKQPKMKELESSFTLMDTSYSGRKTPMTDRYVSNLFRSTRALRTYTFNTLLLFLIGDAPPCQCPVTFYSE
jgi:hypothetical protein